MVFLLLVVVVVVAAAAAAAFMIVVVVVMVVRQIAVLEYRRICSHRQKCEEPAEQPPNDFAAWHQLNHRTHKGEPLRQIAEIKLRVVIKLVVAVGVAFTGFAVR